MKKLCFALLLFSFANLSAQLSGFAFLSGQASHGGIKVKFISSSGTSQTDSTLTNANGSFAINISGGVYTVEFSKNGFQPVYYNNNLGLILTNTTVLNNVSLSPGTIVHVTGNVSGNWSNANIYLVNNNITVPAGSALTIQPGTLVKFNGNYSLTVNGILNAIGNPSSKIIFSSNSSTTSPVYWNGITLTNSQSIIKNCIIEYAMNAIGIAQGSPPIEDNEIRKFTGTGIWAHMGSSSVIKNNIIHDFNVEWASGINSYQNNLTIECNTIYSGSGRGIILGDGSSVKNNLIYNIIGVANSNSNGVGISCYYISNSRIENNIIHNCSSGIENGENVGTGPSPLIINNTIHNCGFGIVSRGIYGRPTIVDNIICNNQTGIQQFSYPECTPSLVSNNLFWNNSNADFGLVQILPLGQIVNTNSNGDPVDSYFNVFKDPLFVNNTPPYYSSSSPCINAGHSQYSPNIGCDPSAMCASMVLGVKEAEKTTSTALFPNPFASVLTLSGPNMDKIAAVSFYDLSGKRYTASFERNSGSSVSVKKEDLATGLYFLEITFSNSSKEYLRVIKQ